MPRLRVRRAQSADARSAKNGMRTASRDAACGLDAPGRAPFPTPPDARPGHDGKRRRRWVRCSRARGWKGCWAVRADRSRWQESARREDAPKPGWMQQTQCQVFPAAYASPAAARPAGSSGRQNNDTSGYARGAAEVNHTRRRIGGLYPLRLRKTAFSSLRQCSERATSSHSTCGER